MDCTAALQPLSSHTSPYVCPPVSQLWHLPICCLPSSDVAVLVRPTPCARLCASSSLLLYAGDTATRHTVSTKAPRKQQHNIDTAQNTDTTQRDTAQHDTARQQLPRTTYLGRSCRLAHRLACLLALCSAAQRNQADWRVTCHASHSCICMCVLLCLVRYMCVRARMCVCYI
ncbi:hypothetical protein K431DRAFT_60047 [Polychaeton citri CBS 116435]|uniref:Uncharacterized protein n=1 Tax=Polychaeton citri CBS 116435 TaxID=1314669 RepID=A0A9P4UN88_9PEZI|nr:hypothetical protein K431DRAFT_60047 [Polychaeton citri CBS 116435]